MCTVSFVTSSNGIIITSNRDEKFLREPASLPQCFQVGKHQLHYPVDGKAKGTWFVVRNDGTIGVLLNGAFKPHTVKSSYRMSRGLVLPTIFQQENPVTALQQMDLNGIENFTLLIYHQQEVHECKWNGEALFIVQLNEQIPHIYSSVTLYNASMIQQRELWFEEWLQTNPSPKQADAIEFHSSTNSQNKEFGLQINRNNSLQTVSITSVCITNNTALLQHDDLLQKVSSQQTIALLKQEVLQPC